MATLGHFLLPLVGAPLLGALGCSADPADEGHSQLATALEPLTSPTGLFESVTCDGFAQGYASDPDSPSNRLAVHMYLNGTLGIGTAVGFPIASVDRGGTIGRHGFKWQIPDLGTTPDPVFPSGRLYAYALDATGDAATLLSPTEGIAYQGHTISGSTGIVGATVTVTGGNTTITKKTSRDGTYSIRVYCPGTYAVSVARTGPRSSCAFTSLLTGKTAQNVTVGPNATADFTDNCGVKIRKFLADASASDPGLVTLTWRADGTDRGLVYVYDASFPKNRFLGWQGATGGGAGIDKSVSFYVQESGLYRYKLAATNAGDNWYATDVATVQSPGSPTITSANPHYVTMSDTAACVPGTPCSLPAASINFAYPIGGFVSLIDATNTELQRTPTCTPTSTSQACAGTYTPTFSNGPATMGTYTYYLRYCIDKPSTATVQSHRPRFCGPKVAASVVIKPALFVGPYRNYYATATDVTVSWNHGPTSTATYKFRSPTLQNLPCVSSSNGTGHATIGAAILGCTTPPCLYDLVLATCPNNGKCSDEEQIFTSQTTNGYVRKNVSEGTPVYHNFSVIAKVCSDADCPKGAVLANILSPYDGKVHWDDEGLNFTDGSFITGERQIAWVWTDNSDHKQFIIGAHPWRTHSYKRDFNCNTIYDPTHTSCGRALPVFSVGDKWPDLPLDVVSDGANNLWGIAEFTESLLHANTDTGLVDVLDIPLQTHAELGTSTGSCDPSGTQPCYYVKNRPFSWGYPPVASATPKSGIAERVYRTSDGLIWFAQGGEEFGSSTGNHSRIGRYNPAAQDLPYTDWDDRFCVYNIPDDGNEVIGITSIGTRIFFSGLDCARIPALCSIGYAVDVGDVAT